MAILRLLPASSMSGSPFVDYLNVTIPLEQGDAFRALLDPLAESLGSFEWDATLSMYRFFVPERGGLVERGSLKVKPRGRILLVSASGGVLQSLRNRGLYGEYLSVLGQFPHRISMMHATCDYHVQNGAATIQAFVAAKDRGELALTRKGLRPDQCTELLGTNAAGEKTGTLYLGQRANADVWAKIYDKRHERLCRGFADPGELIRVEAAIQSGVGATLRDAHDPSSIFFHFAGRSLVEVPMHVPAWAPHGEGFILEKPRQRLLFERLENITEHSEDVSRLCRLAYSEYGDKALQVLQGLLRRKLQGIAASGVVVAS